MYEPQDYQLDYHQNPSRFKAILGGRRSGKTYSSAREFYKRLCRDLALQQQKGQSDEFMLYWIVTPDYTLGKVAMRELFATIRQHDDRHVKSWNKSYKELFLYPNILVEFKSANNPEKLVAVKLRGMWADETARMKKEAWMAGLRQCLTDYAGWGLFSTSPLGKNWYYEEILRRGDPNDVLYDPQFANFLFKTVQNNYISRSELEAAKRQMPTKYYRREYEASLEEFFGQIFEEYNRKIHRYPRQGVQKPKTFSAIVAGQDWGYSTPGCLSVFGKTHDEPAKYFELETIYEDHMLVTDPARDNSIIYNSSECQTWLEHTLRIKDKYKKLYPGCPPVRFYAGKDRPDYIETYSGSGLNMMETDYSVQAGIQTLCNAFHVSEVTGLPRIFFLQDTIEATDREYESYRWQEHKDGTPKDEPIKKNDHRPDADRYMIHGEEAEPAAAMGMVDVDDNPDWYQPETYMTSRNSLI